jgi:pyridoxine 4-dehydrogenase
LAGDLDTATLGDLTVRRLGLGTVRILGANAWGRPSDAGAMIRLLREAVAHGVNLIDTADCYGPYVAENLIAQALHPYPDDLVIATKGGVRCDRPGSWRPDGDPQRLRRCCEGSLRRLKLEQIDLYQLHGVDPRVPIEESIGVLAELQTKGLIRHVAVCNVTLPELRRAQQITQIVSVQNRYNLFDRSCEDVLVVCERDRVGFMPWFPLGRGELAHNHALCKVARSREASRAQVALAWLLHRSVIMLPIPGTSSMTHLLENLNATRIRLEPQELSMLETSKP